MKKRIKIKPEIKKEFITLICELCGKKDKYLIRIWKRKEIRTKDKIRYEEFIDKLFKLKCSYCNSELSLENTICLKTKYEYDWGYSTLGMDFLRC